MFLQQSDDTAGEWRGGEDVIWLASVNVEQNMANGQDSVEKKRPELSLLQTSTEQPRPPAHCGMRASLRPSFIPSPRH